MKKSVLMLGAALVLTGCGKAPDPMTDSYVDQSVVVPAAKDAKGKVTIPEIYRLHLASESTSALDHRYLWIQVDARTYAACPVNADFPACKQGIEGVE